MLIVFSTINRDTQIRNFSWWFNSLEFAFDAVSALTLKGNQIINIEIIEDNHRIQLPAEAFDGSCISTYTQSIEDECIRLLSERIDMRTD